MMQMLGSVAEFQREMSRERSRAGLAHAKAQGRRLGRRRSINRDQRRKAIRWIADGQTQAEIARAFGVQRYPSFSHPASITKIDKACGSTDPDPVRGGPCMNVSLTPQLEEFVRRKVESGLYNNASEVIREGLRLLIERDAAKERDKPDETSPRDTNTEGKK
jgi:Arc/MetJ-type ribon-helix-helix transcriptional regulator